MTEEEIIAKVNDALAEEFEFDPDDMTPEAKLVEDLELDSLDFVDLVVVLQNTFGLKLRDDDGVKNVRTLGEVHTLVIDRVRDK
jgi:acyl carrier protein